MNIYIFAKVSEVNSSAFIYKLFHEDFSSIVLTNIDLTNTDLTILT